MDSVISSDTLSSVSLCEERYSWFFFGRKKSVNKYSVSPKMPRSGAPAIFMNSVYVLLPIYLSSTFGLFRWMSRSFHESHASRATLRASCSLWEFIIPSPVSWLPIVRELVGLGLTLISLCLATSLSLVTIAIGWIAHRPLLGLSLLVAAAVPIYLSRKRAQNISRTKTSEE